MRTHITLLALLFSMSQLSAQTDFEAYKQQQQRKLNAYSKQQKEVRLTVFSKPGK